jgi:hypothetical protein
MCAKVADMIGAASLSNQLGRLSGPAAEYLRLSRAVKTANSEGQSRGSEQLP